MGAAKLTRHAAPESIWIKDANANANAGVRKADICPNGADFGESLRTLLREK